MTTNDDLTSETTNTFGEPLYMELNYVNPKAGRYKDQPKQWWAGKAVRVYTEVVVDGVSKLAPVWLDFVEFRQEVVDGAPVWMGYGTTQQKVGAEQVLAAGLEVPFSPDEVFDVLERTVLPADGVYLPLARAG
jgi:hypothetical protein